MYSNEKIFSCDSKSCSKAYYDNSETCPMVVYKRSNDDGEVY